MASTPHKLVHWALDVSMSDFGSPFSAATSESSSTSSLQYINSQLIAHGFAQSPGLSLEGLAKDDADKVVKCLLGMLSQRINDMSRTEDLTTKIRTLSYDHERLMSMYQTTKDRAANAERETNVHKSRLTSVARSLQSTETAHKHTVAELQRTRTSMQALRTAHQTEIKKIEKEKERMTEKWSKIADAQLKLGATTSGLRCANSEVVDAPDVQIRGKGKGFLEVALEQAEQARKELFEQNARLRGLILSAANEMQSVLHNARNCTSSEGQEEPALLTLATLFPLSPTDAAGDKLASLLSSIRESISRLSKSTATSNVASSTSHVAPNGEGKSHDQTEVDRLQAVIETLRSELEQAQKQASVYASQTQALFDRFAEAEDERPIHGDVGEMSVDLMTAPARDEERQRLDTRFKELEAERRKFTEAAVRLGKEKATLEAERIKFLEEKRSWQVELMLADLPPTPGPSSTIPPTERDRIPTKSPRKSPHRSPHKSKSAAIPVGKVGTGKKIRVSRRSSGVGPGLTSPRKVIPPFETEVIPSSALQMPAFKMSIALSQPQPPVLAPAFVLPPPSPAASLPLQQSSVPTSSRIPPLLQSIADPESKHAVITASRSDGALSDAQPRPSEAITISMSAPELASSAVPVPSTPVPRPFPMAKPLAARMLHAYSPAKPSPLSRILMLANSPDSPDIDRPPPLGALSEENESEGLDTSPTPAYSAPAPVAAAKSLAAELGITEDIDSTLREKRVEPNIVKANASHSTAGRLTMKEKGKGKAEPAVGMRTRPAVALEKENVKRAMMSVTASNGVGGTTRISPVERDPKKIVKAPPKPFTRPKNASKLAPGKGGARRVPIDSAEAAPVGPAWKG
ncbi:hypothetical protein AcW1_006435 [Taiwanofungus camphoratus]|nr:hypothetical protein AcW1_006435 [Antrodia cinnamomea]